MPQSFQALELVDEEELVEDDVADVARELRDVVDEVVVELAGVLAVQPVKGEVRKVVDLHVAADRTEEDHVAGGVVHAVGQVRGGVKNVFLGTFQDAVEAAQHDEGQDDLAVFGPLEVAAQDLGDRPDESAQVLNVSGHVFLVLVLSFGCRPERLRVDPRFQLRRPGVFTVALVLNSWFVLCNNCFAHLSIRMRHTLIPLIGKKAYAAYRRWSIKAPVR